MTAQDSTFKIHASAANDIMTSPKTKVAKEAGELSVTTKKFCNEWRIKQKYNKYKDIHSIPMDKGTLQESGAIDFYTKYKGAFLIKNEIYFEDEFFCGTPDILSGDFLADIKCPKDCFTLPEAEKDEIIITSDPPKNYYYQLQVYMHLTGVKKSELVYVLMDMPDHFIESEINSLCWRMGWDKEDIREKVTKNMTYSDLPDNLRIKTYPIEYDKEVIEKIQERVLQCRKYINSLKK